MQDTFKGKPLTPEEVEEYRQVWKEMQAKRQAWNEFQAVPSYVERIAENPDLWDEEQQEA